MEMKDNNSVKYIDVTNGSCEAYVRCDTVEAAELFVQKSYDGKRLTILKGKMCLYFVTNMFFIIHLSIISIFR